MKFDRRFAEVFGQVDLVLDKPGIPKGALLSPRLKHRLVAGAVAALLAFAVGILIAAFGARAADEPAQPRPAIERAGTDSVRVQPTAEQFAPPNQPNFSDTKARYVDELYRQLLGLPPATSSSSGSSLSTRLRPAPGDGAAGSVRRWVNPR